MNLKEKLEQDLKTVLKAGQSSKADVLRFLLAQIHNREIEKKGTGQAPLLTDEETIEVLQREVKKRKEAIELFKKGNREDLVKKEEQDLSYISEYLPAALSRQEIEKIVEELKSQGLNDFNSLMREAMKKLRGRADGRLVSEVVKEKL